MAFIDPNASFTNILVLNDSKMLFLEEDNPFELTVLRNGHGQICHVEDRKWFLLTCLLLLQISECSKTWKCF